MPQNSMKCHTCDNRAKISFPNGDLCKSCFLGVLYKRIKKELRSEARFKRDARVLVFGALATHFLKHAIEGLPLQITETKIPFTKEILKKDFARYDKVVIPWTADDEAEVFYLQLQSEKPDFSMLKQEKIVKLFKPILDKELLQASKLLKIPFVVPVRDAVFAKIQKRYNTHGMVKSADEFRKAVR